MKLATRCAVLLALAGAAAAQESKPDPRAWEREYETLVSEHEDAQAKFYERLRADMQKRAKEAERLAEEAKKRAETRPEGAEPEAVPAVMMMGPGMDGDPTAAFVPRFEDLAARAKDSDVGVKALTWLVANAPVGVGAASVAGDKALAKIVDAAATSPAVAEACETIGRTAYGPRVATIEAALRKILAATPHRRVKAAATTQLGLLLHEDEGIDYVQGKNGDYEKKDRYTKEVFDARKAEAKALLYAVRKDYADVDLTAPAEGVLFEMEKLQVGMTAPDFEATDSEGVKFKLSDYAGKIVAIDFWGFW